MGFNISWIFVEGVGQEELYAALDLASTGKPASPDNLGTTDQPLSGFEVKPGWSGVFARYAQILDVTIGTDPPRLARLPAEARAVTCVVLEHAGITYSSLWQGGRHVWQMRHQPSVENPIHLVFWGDLPKEYVGIWETALGKAKVDDSFDTVFDVPLETAALLTGYRHDRNPEPPFENVVLLKPLDGNDLTKLGEPPHWWQMVGSMRYGPPPTPEEIAAENAKSKEDLEKLLEKWIPHRQ